MCYLSGGLGSIDGQTQFALCSTEVILGFRAVAHHVVVIRRTCRLDFMDGFNDVFVHGVKIMPIVDLCGQYRTCENANVRAKAEASLFIVTFSVQS